MMNLTPPVKDGDLIFFHPGKENTALCGHV